MYSGSAAKQNSRCVELIRRDVQCFFSQPSIVVLVDFIGHCVALIVMWLKLFSGVDNEHKTIYSKTTYAVFFFKLLNIYI